MLKHLIQEAEKEPENDANFTQVKVLCEPDVMDEWAVSCCIFLAHASGGSSCAVAAVLLKQMINMHLTVDLSP